MAATAERIAVAVLGVLWLAPAALWLRVYARRRGELDDAGRALVLVRVVGNALAAALMLASAATDLAALLGAAAVVLLLQMGLHGLLRRRRE